MTDHDAALATTVRADLTRYYGRHSLPLLARAVLLERTFRVVLTLRLCQAAPSRPLRIAAVVLHRIASGRAAVDLPWKTRIGPGFRLFHGWGAVVNTEAVIGADVSLFHGVTLGQGDRIAADGSRTTGFPVIEDEVWIGPHAVVVGGVTIGRGARIAAGAVVSRDVEPHTMVAGNPATVVRTGVPADVLNPAGALAS
jgi:serine O-acetyltransferase